MVNAIKYPENSFIHELLQDNEFKAWLWNSKIVDSNWQPLILIHGSKAKFEMFDSEMVGSKSPKNRDPWYFGRWFYFTPHTSLAKKYWDIIYKCILRADKILTFEDYHCTTRDFSPEKLPAEVRDDIIERYNKLLEEKSSTIKPQDPWEISEWIPVWWYVWGIEEEYDEKVLAEAFREVLMEQWYQWVKWKNPVSWEYEYVIFNPEDIYTFEVDIGSYPIFRLSRKIFSLWYCELWN